MTDGQVTGIVLITLGVFGIWLESQCKFGAFLKAMYDGPSFIEFIIALIIFLSVLAIIGEPGSTYLAAVVILGMILIDSRVNGSNTIFAQLGI